MLVTVDVAECRDLPGMGVNQTGDLGGVAPVLGADDLEVDLVG